MKKVIGEQLRTFVYQNFLLGQGFVLGDSDSFLQNGVIDSMGVLELVAFVQETYGITVELIPENLDSIGNVTAYVSRKLDSKALIAPNADLGVLV